MTAFVSLFAAAMASVAPQTLNVPKVEAHQPQRLFGACATTSDAKIVHDVRGAAGSDLFRLTSNKPLISNTRDDCIRLLTVRGGISLKP